jgi:hypothetical protein
MNQQATARGRAIAALLAGVWREPDAEPPAFEEIAPLLLASGSAALGWRRIRYSNARSSAVALELQQAYRLHALQAALHERALLDLIRFLRSAGLDPILGKGWAIARQYPEPGLRPYGDFDLFVRAGDYDAVQAALREAGAPAASVDLHRGAAELDDRDFDDLYARSRVINLEDAAVRIFGPEDHLRLLCLHMFRHGAWRPLWLVDVAVAMETRRADFDWDYFLRGDARRTDWTACAIGLAHQLLGAEVSGTPIETRARNLPRWLMPVTLDQWGRGETPHGTRRPMVSYLRNPAGAVEALRIRWPNAIEATVGVHGAFNNQPRLPFQLGECLRRGSAFIAQLPALLSNRE